MPRASVTSQYWTFMFYDDSGEYDRFKQLLNDLGLLVAISPLHDKDIDPKSDTGDLKKAHRHIVCKFPTPVGRRAVVDGITKNFAGCPDYVQRIINPAKMVEYLTHENQPEKHHYSMDDVQWLNGATLEDFPDEFQLSKKERKEAEELQNLMELLDIISELKPSGVMELSMYLRVNDKPELLKTVFKNSYYFDRCIKSVVKPEAADNK